MVLCGLNRRRPHAATLMKALAGPARSNRRHVAVCRAGHPSSWIIHLFPLLTTAGFERHGFSRAGQVLYFCHSPRASARGESAFLTFSAASLAVPMRRRGDLGFSPCGNSHFVARGEVPQWLKPAYEQRLYGTAIDCGKSNVRKWVEGHGFSR